MPGEDSPEIQSARELIRLEQLAEWNDKKYHIEKHGDNFSLIVVGETYGNPEFQAKQVELIRLARPEYVLHEFLAAWIYDPKTQKFEKQKGRKFNMFDDDPENISLPSGLVLAANEMGFKTIGCDLTLGELSRFEKQLAR